MPIVILSVPVKAHPVIVTTKVLLSTFQALETVAAPFSVNAASTAAFTLARLATSIASLNMSECVPFPAQTTAAVICVATVGAVVSFVTVSAGLEVFSIKRTLQS